MLSPTLRREYMRRIDGREVLAPLVEGYTVTYLSNITCFRTITARRPKWHVIGKWCLLITTPSRRSRPLPSGARSHVAQKERSRPGLFLWPAKKRKRSGVGRV